MAVPVRLGVLISGGGRTLQNFIDRSADGRLKATVVRVISSDPEAYGLERAARHNIPADTVPRSDYGSVSEHSEAITAGLREAEVDLIAMAGFLWLYRFPDFYQGRVMNIHPALLPSFGGEGFYGDRVHRAVLQYGCKITGCTVHFADRQYDHGPIILQKAVPVEEGDDAHSLAARVFEKEKEAYPEAINLFAEDRLEIDGRRVRILPPGGD